VPSELRNLFRSEHESLYLPSDKRLWPRPAFMTYHRELYAGA
jgi:putative restriction endonuclease